MRVIEAVWEPGAVTAPFKGFSRAERAGVAAVVLKGGTIEHQYASGKKTRQERRPGDVFWQAPDTPVEARQNTGNTKLDMIQVALKKMPPTRQYKGPVVGEKKILENAHLAAFEITLAPGAKVAMHAYAPRVWVVLEGGEMRSTDKAGKAQQARFRSLEVVWLPPQEHTFENIGKANERIISLELK